MEFQGFLRYLTSEKRYSNNTVIAYEHDLTQFSKYLLESAELDSAVSATHFMIRSWMVSLLEGGNDARTVARKLSTLKRYYKFLLREKVILKDPTLKVNSPKQSKKLPVFIEEKSMDNLFNVFDFEDSTEGRRNRVIMDLLYQAGLRVSELISLTPSSFDFGNRRMKVLGKRNKERQIPLSDEILESVKALVDEISIDAGQEIFRDENKPLSRFQVYTIVNRYLTEVSTISKRSPHVMRHTFATHMLNNGAGLSEIKELLGHSSLASTQVYTHNSIEKLKQVHQKLHPRS